MTLPPESAKEFESLHSEMSAILERLAWAILRDWPLAADAVQETFILLTEKWASVPAENRRGWLVRTVQLTSQNLRRKKSRLERLPTEAGWELLNRSAEARASEASTGGTGIDEIEAEKQERLERLATALSHLPESQLRVVKMRLEGKQTFSQIADELDISLGTALSRMRLALEKLRRMLD